MRQALSDCFSPETVQVGEEEGERVTARVERLIRQTTDTIQEEDYRLWQVRTDRVVERSLEEWMQMQTVG